jgi:O-antigen/teichoic acid export membrane protein
MSEAFALRFVKGLLSTGLGVGLQILSGFFSYVIAARILSKEEFGVFVLLQVIAIFFAMLGDLIVQNMAVARTLAATSKERKADIANTAICCKVVVGLLMCLVFFACRPLLNMVFKHSELPSLLIYVPPLLFLSSLEDLLLFTLQGLHAYKKIAVAQILSGLSRLSCIVLFLLIWKMHVTGMIYAFLFASIISTIYQYFSLPIKRRLFFEQAEFIKLFRFGFPLGLNGILTFFFTRIDRFMIGILVSPIGVAYYDVAAKLPESFQRLYVAFQSVFFPHMSELFADGRRNEAAQLLDSALRLTSFVAALAALVVTAFQREIVQTLFSGTYLEAAPGLALLMVSLVMALVGNVMGTTLVSAGYPDKPIRMSIVMSALVIVGNLVLIPVYGFMGAVYAACIANYVTNLTISVWYLRGSGVRLSIGTFLKPVAICAFYWVIFAAINPEHVWLKVVIILLFVLSCLPFSIIRRRDLSIFFAAIGLRKASLAMEPSSL